MALGRGATPPTPARYRWLALLLCVLLTAAIALLSTAAAFAAENWTSFQLTMRGNGASEPHVVISDSGEAVAAWEQPTPKGAKIQSSARRPGSGWSPPTNVAGATSTNVHLAANPAGETIAAWLHYVGGRADLESSTRRVGGSWSSPVRISPRNGLTHEAAIAIAIDRAGEAIAVWVEHRQKRFIVRGAIRSPSGTWSAPMRISPKGTRAREPQVAIGRAGEAVTTWSDQKGTIWSASRPRNGPWSAPQRVSFNKEGGGGVQLAVDAAGETVAVWVGENEDGDAVESASRPAGGTWSGAILFADRNGYPAPELAINASGEAVAIWLRSSSAGQGPDAEEALFYAAAFRSAAGTWSHQAPIGATGYGATDGFAARPALSSAGEALVIWPEQGLLLSSSHPKGGTWSTPSALPSGPSLATPLDLLNPRLALSADGEAVALWEVEEPAMTVGNKHRVRSIQGAWRSAP